MFSFWIKLFSGIACFLVLFNLVATPVLAQTRDWADFGDGRCVVERQINVSGDVQAVSGTHQVATIRGLECLIANILMIAVTIIGIAGFIMLIYGSFRYLLSGGNSKGTEAARNTMTFAIVGLVVALSAFFIINIISQFTGVSILQTFNIPEFVVENGQQRVVGE